MMRTFNELFDINATVSESLFRLNPGRMKSLYEASVIVDSAHSAPTSPGDRLDHDRIPNPFGDFQPFVLGSHFPIASRANRHSGFSGLFTGCILIAHSPHRVW